MAKIGFRDAGAGVREIDSDAGVRVCRPNNQKMGFAAGSRFDRNPSAHLGYHK